MLDLRASLVAQMVKNLPAGQETWIQSRVGKIPWRRAPVFLPGEFRGQRSLVGYRPGIKPVLLEVEAQNPHILAPLGSPSGALFVCVPTLGATPVLFSAVPSSH